MLHGEAVITAVGLGSNLDDPVRQVRLALSALASLTESEFLSSSGLYQNPPMGPQDQPDYVNAVALLRTRLQPLPFLKELQRIEQAQGRARHVHWGARTIDLDLLLYGEHIIDDAQLTVPHPGLHERVFVLHPLAEIAANLMVPGKGRVGDLAAAFSATELVRIEEPSQDGPQGLRA